MKKIWTTLTTIITLNTVLFAQQPHNHDHGICGTDHIEESIFGNNEEYQKSREAIEAWIAEYIATHEASEVRKRADGTESQIHRIPVVFHIMYENARDNISKYQIMDAIRVLNEDFRRLNADTGNTRAMFLNVATDMEIEFHLARVNPNGQCTDGINRIQTGQAVSSTNSIKNLSSWDNKKYLNIWTVRAISSGAQGTVLGYAFFPSPNQSGINDGILLRHDRTGTIGTSGSAGRTLVHEAGHYFALHHPFRDGCSGGDFVNDTPPVDAPNFGCNYPTVNSCGIGNLPDMVENYMDYADDICTNIFTNGQKVRSKAVLNDINLRGDISNGNNLKTVGVVGGDVCKPIPDFFAQSHIVCSGDTVKFVDASIGANPNGYQWSFPGGTPSTSTERYPQVTYNQEGVYSVTLTTTNNAGSETKTVSKAVWVGHDTPSPFQSWLQQDFEIYDYPDGNWSAQNLGSADVKIGVTNDAASSGNRSLKIPLNNTNQHGIYRIVTPKIDLTRATNATLSYTYAFAPKESNFGDRMFLKVSTDCGKTWTTRRTLSGAQFQTAPVQSSGNFVPQSASQWSTIQQGLGAFATGDDEILIMWEIEGRGGNNFYIDDINLSVTLSEDQYDLNRRSFEVFPNPTSSKLNIEFRSMTDGSTQFNLYNATGQMVWQQSERSIAGEKREIVVDTFEQFPAGIYFMHMENDGQKEVKKVVKY
jgi:PKD repeat protein